MKKLQKIFALMLVLCMAVTGLTISAAAADSGDVQVIRFDDGSYLVVTIEYDQPETGIAAFATESRISGTKSYAAYSNYDELLWTFYVHGSFTYNGSTASATSASYSYEITSSSWSFVKGSASYSGDTATATGSFKNLLFPNSVTLTLTCSPNGVLS